jgi:putative nucleotidyltransferase with HDIG domain
MLFGGRVHNSSSLFALPGAPRGVTGEARPRTRRSDSDGPNVLALTASEHVASLLSEMERQRSPRRVRSCCAQARDVALSQWATGAFDVLLVDLSLGGARELLEEIRGADGIGLHPVLLCGERGSAISMDARGDDSCERLGWDEVDETNLFHAVRYAALAGRKDRSARDDSHADRRMQDAVIETLLNTLELHDPIVAAHQRRVAELVGRIADVLNLPGEDREALVIAAKVHDIGKIAVPSEISSKPAALTPIEAEIMRGHVTAGHDVLAQTRLPRAIAEAVYQHHERLDGSGYPRRLAGSDLTLQARILCVADVFEAMTSHRPYRPAHRDHEALAFLREHAGDLFDPDVVAACREAVRASDPWSNRISASFPMLSLARASVSPGDTPGELQAYAARTQGLADALGHPMSEMAMAMASQVEIKDAYTAGHQRRVADLSGAIADRLGLDADARANLTIGALLHDIGKVTIPNKILHKSSELTSVEFELIKTHVECGFQLLDPVSFPGPVSDIVLHHHERLDGSGYPRGIRGDAIPPEARIIAVADTTEAMMFDRPYRPALGWDAAVRELRFGRKTRYDADVVDACVDVLASWRREPGEGPWFRRPVN